MDDTLQRKRNRACLSSYFHRAHLTASNEILKRGFLFFSIVSGKRVGRRVPRRRRVRNKKNMKKLQMTLLMLCGIALATLPLVAETEKVGNYTWTYRINGDAAEICGWWPSATSPEPTGAVTIPSTLGGKSVTSIGGSVFYNCTNLTSITIPNSVTNIGYMAFRNCSGLTRVTIPNGVTSIGDYAFEYCGGLTNVNLSSCWWLTDIGHGAFDSCTNLTEIAIPYSVERIGRNPFNYCNALFDTNSISGVILVDGWAVGYTDEEFTTVTNENYGYSYKELDLSGVRGIADGAFEWCPQMRHDGGLDSLVMVNLGNYIRRIGASAFAECDFADFNLSGVHIGSIGESAFSGCYSVSMYDDFANIDVIEDGAFTRCYGLADNNGFIVVKGVLHGYCGQGPTDIPDGVTRIGTHAFGWTYDYSSIGDITIPDSVTNIAHEAFYGYGLYLGSMSIGKGVAVIEDDAFAGCHIESMTVDDENPYYKVEDGILKTKEGSQIIYAFGSSFGVSVGMHGAWRTGGDAEWGAWDCAQSGAIDDGQESWLEVPVSGTGVISFRWKASSESYRDEVFDFGTFSVDGVEGAMIGGKTDWTNVTQLIVGSGTHVVRWTYKKDDDGTGGSDCVWLDDVQYVRKVCVSFSGGDETEGNPPEPMIADLGAGIVLPNAASLVRAKHTFAGWRLGDVVWTAGAEFVPGDQDVVLSAVWDAKRVATPVISVAERFNGESTIVTMTCETSGASIYYTLDGTEPTTGGILYEGPFNLTETATISAIAIKDDWFDSETASAHSVRIPVSLSGCLNASGLVFRTGGAAEWTTCLDESHDGEASARSGNVGDGQMSWIETVVTNSGIVSFWWKVSSEASKKKIYDGISFSVDGEQIPAIPALGGEQDWTNVVYAIESPGQHVLRWTYEKDGQDKMGEDCAWLDEVTWTANDPLPALDEQASADDVAAIIGEMSDERLQEKVVGTAAYGAFRIWVDGKGVSHAVVRDAPNAWLSYVLDAPELMTKATPLVSEDIVIESIGSSGAASGAFDIVVDIAGAEIGTAAQLAEVLDVEGATELNESAFSSDGLTFTLQRTTDGKVKAMVTPSGSPSSFFLRVKVK